LHISLPCIAISYRGHLDQLGLSIDALVFNARIQ
jgi:hypothetical protein